MSGNPDDLVDYLRAKESIAPHLPVDIELEDLIDQGGQGIVYRGTARGIEAAVKLYLPGQVQKRIEREVEALATLNCKTIVRLIWSGTVEIDGTEIHAVATEFVPGSALNRLGRTLTHDDLGVVAFDVATAIEKMWERRIVHRDLKPGNILLRPNGRACVIDLGLARHLDLSSITGVGYTGGTLGYMSPEQTRAVRQLTCKSDLYALGIILIEGAIGRHPTNRDQLRLLQQRLHEHLPVELSGWKHAGLVQSLLEPRPTRRPMPTAILTALQDYSLEE